MWPDNCLSTGVITAPKIDSIIDLMTGSSKPLIVAAGVGMTRKTSGDSSPTFSESLVVAAKASGNDTLSNDSTRRQRTDTDAVNTPSLSTFIPAQANLPQRSAIAQPIPPQTLTTAAKSQGPQPRAISEPLKGPSIREILTPGASRSQSSTVHAGAAAAVSEVVRKVKDAAATTEVVTKSAPVISAIIHVQENPFVGAVNLQEPRQSGDLKAPTGPVENQIPTVLSPLPKAALTVDPIPAPTTGLPVTRPDVGTQKMVFAPEAVKESVAAGVKGIAEPTATRIPITFVMDSSNKTLSTPVTNSNVSTTQDWLQGRIPATDAAPDDVSSIINPLPSTPTKGAVVPAVSSEPDNSSPIVFPANSEDAIRNMSNVTSGGQVSIPVMSKVQNLIQSALNEIPNGLLHLDAVSNSHTVASVANAAPFAAHATPLAASSTPFLNLDVSASAGTPTRENAAPVRSEHPSAKPNAAIPVTFASAQGVDVAERTVPSVVANPLLTLFLPVAGLPEPSQSSVGNLSAAIETKETATGTNTSKGGIRDVNDNAPAVTGVANSTQSTSGQAVSAKGATHSSQDGDQSQAGAGASTQEPSPVPAPANFTDSTAVTEHASGSNVATLPSLTLTQPGVPSHPAKTPDLATPVAVATPQALPLVSSAKLIQSVGQSEMRLGMRSNEFGNISISTSTARDIVSAQISLDHGELARTLAAQLPEMQARLTGGQAMDVRIEMNGQSASQGQSQGMSGGAPNHSADGSQSERQTRSTTPIHADDGFAERRPSHVGSMTAGEIRLNTRLDITV